ncbi:MAG: DUF3710 domain-containing protein [Actinobacteria bacterium]|nr:DUF3710 domain-containing protein [Actinomycetota bacterium]MTA89998.1 DUF3710 domain-containing protein [Actinomycetota bacterium]
MILDKAAPLDRESAGPFDSSEVGVLNPYLDFGALRIAPRSDMQIRAEVEDASKRVVAITIEINSHTLQLQAFAATRSEGLWLPTLEGLSNSITEQGGKATKRTGVLGVELLAEIPNQNKTTLFIGCDGPRWFLRGLISGSDLTGPTYADLVSVFRSTVVNRGDVALPPGDLLPLRLPVANV